MNEIGNIKLALQEIKNEMDLLDKRIKSNDSNVLDVISTQSNLIEKYNIVVGIFLSMLEKTTK